ncbi:hypothetical protein [Thalassiella azotivora]
MSALALQAVAAVGSAATVLAGATEQEPDPTSISPGLVGFLATFAVVLASVVVFVSMNRRLRGVQHRAQHEDQPAAGAGGAGPQGAPTGTSADGGGPDRGGLPRPASEGHHGPAERAAESSLEDPGPVADDPGTASGDDLRR